MRSLQILTALLLFVASPAFAGANTVLWTVTQRSGDVQIVKKGLQPASAPVRATLSPGDTIATGATGRAMLTRGDDYVVVAPSSRLVVPQGEQAKGFTRLIQQVGTMLYKVKHTGVPHFAVDTPMLAAVVKGTSFTVVVDKDRAAVQVTEGLVEVSSVAGDARRLVERGVTVYVGRERPHEIIEMKPGAADLPPSSGTGTAVKIETSGDVPLSTVTDLTGGLVREAPPTSVVAVAVPPAGLVPAVATTPSVITPVVDAIAPIAGVVDSTAPAVVEPIVDIVDPVVDIVETTVPAIVEPVVEIVETTVPAIIEPIVEIVETTVPAVTEPVVEIVEVVVPEVTQPVIEIVETIIPAVTEPVGGLLGGLFGGRP